VPVISNRERAVIQAIARGSTTAEVARDLYISPHTVRSYVKTAMRKLGSRTRAHGVAVAMQHGLISGVEEDAASSDAGVPMVAGELARRR
jgi:DNA-binding CsgD family transcriptional regulator